MYTKGQFIDFVSACFGEAKLTNGGLNASVTCPNPKCSSLLKQNKKKFVIQTETGVFHCWSCGIKGRTIYPILKRYFPHFVKEYTEKFSRAFTDDLEDKVDVEPIPASISLPKGFKPLCTNLDGLDVKKALSYLDVRGVHTSGLWYWKFGITTEEPSCIGRVILPSFDSEGNLNFWTGRSYQYNVRPKYFNPPFHREEIIFNELNIDWTEEITIVEGPFDLVKCNHNATCLLGSTLEQDYLLFQKIVENRTPVLLALDNDAKNKSFKIAKMLYEYEVPVRLLDIPREKNDVGQLTRLEFETLRNEAEFYTIDSSLYHKILGL